MAKRLTTSCPDCPGLSANQYGVWFRFCPKHYALVLLASQRRGISPDELFEEAVDFYMGHHHPDAKRWLM